MRPRTTRRSSPAARQSILVSPPAATVSTWASTASDAERGRQSTFAGAPFVVGVIVNVDHVVVDENRRQLRGPAAGAVGRVEQPRVDEDLSAHAANSGRGDLCCQLDSVRRADRRR